jgi:hypothetical protein
MILALLLLLGVAEAAADTMPAPEQLVRATSKEVLEAIKRENLSTRLKTLMSSP